MTRSALGIALVCAAASSLVAASDVCAQERAAVPAAATRIVRGVVVRAADDRPLARARIVGTRTGRGGFSASVLTDARGEFSFAIPPDTAFTLRVQKAGYATTTLPIGEGRRGVPTELRVAIARGAVVTGRAIFDNGSPILSGILRLRVRRLEPGADTAALSADAITVPLDNRGEYRVSGLSPGRYSIGPQTSNPLQGVLRILPVIVDVPEGAELGGIDIRIENTPAALTSPPVAAAKPAVGGSIIRGRVTGTSGEPLASASVGVVAGSRRMTATSDSDGRFEVTGVPAGTVTVESTLSGYALSRHGARDGQLPGLPITVKANQELDGIDLVMSRASVVSGTVVDEAGEPMQDASVQLLRVSGTSVGTVDYPLPPGTLTLSQISDDRGRFRVTGVNPGSYFLVASIAGETDGLTGRQRFAYLPAYYPGTPDPGGAARLDVGAEQDLSGFTIPLARVAVARVEGIATDSGGGPLTGQIRLSRARTSGVAQQPRQSPAGSNGEFSFADVRPGQYAVHAVTGTGPSGPEFAVQAITVTETDPPMVVLRSSPGSRVSGSIVLEGPPGAVLWGYASNVVPVDIALSTSASATSSGAFSSGTTFAMSGLGGLARLVFSTPDEKWFLKSILLDGTEIADRPFEFGVGGRAYTDVDVVFSANGASIAGRVTDERGSPVQHYAAVVFGVDRDTWFQGSRWVKMARATSDGTFSVTALPPGDYWVAALDRLEEVGAWQDPEFLRDLSSRAVRVTLGERQSQTTALRVIRR